MDDTKIEVNYSGDIVADFFTLFKKPCLIKFRYLVNVIHEIT